MTSCRRPLYNLSLTEVDVAHKVNYNYNYTYTLNIFSCQGERVGHIEGGRVDQDNGSGGQDPTRPPGAGQRHLPPSGLSDRGLGGGATV